MKVQSSLLLPSRLGLKDQQEREIVHVLVDCCLQEKTYNPFYAFLAGKFCAYERRFQVTGPGGRLPSLSVCGPEAQRSGWAPRVHMVPLARVTNEGAVTWWTGEASAVQCFSYLRDSIPKERDDCEAVSNYCIMKPV